MTSSGKIGTIQVRLARVTKTGLALRLTGRLDSDSEHELLVPLYIFKHTSILLSLIPLNGSHRLLPPPPPPAPRARP